MRSRALVAALCVTAAAGCSGGSGGSSVPGSPDSSQGGGSPVAAAQLIFFSGAINDNLSPSDPNYKQKTLVFGELGLTLDTTASEKSYTGTFSLTPVATTGCPTPSKVFVMGTRNHITFAIKSLTVGLCKLAVADTKGHTGVLWVSISTVSGVGH